MQHSTSCEANTHSASQEFKNPPPPPFMGPKSSIQCLKEPAAGPRPEPDECGPQPPQPFPKSHFNIILQSMLTSSEWYLPFRFSDKKNLYAIFICPVHATCPAHLYLHDMVTLITCGEVYKI